MRALFLSYEVVVGSLECGSLVGWDTVLLSECSVRRQQCHGYGNDLFAGNPALGMRPVDGEGKADRAAGMGQSLDIFPWAADTTTSSEE